ncbi:hypothetical protein [Usitatibacter rugosus]|uniref:hypothetical protein n=1 Tax=Usitatibacter rugosus TaxID=2732067 RepID=UPI001489CAB9|nr:hypothetical protein [Usitatibacter rugosus]
MASNQHLDAVIGEALECATEAAAEIRELGLAPVDRHLRSIGDAVNSLWEVREALYRAHPEVKRDFVAESEVDEARFEALCALHNRACETERAGNHAEAATLFKQLHEQSKFGFFKLCAEAGLFRTDDAHKA